MPANPTPVTLGINWYENFDFPTRHGRYWWIGRGDFGALRGGHCICAKPEALKDTALWWKFYDQKEEGACVGFACSRTMSLMNRERYDATWNYKEAQKIDEWEGEDYDGTSLRAGLEVLRTQGAVRFYKGEPQPPDPTRGIHTYRWAKTVDEIILALAYFGDRVLMDHLQAIPLLNSWGRNYPRRVWIPYKAVERLLVESGEAAVITDR